MNRCRLFLALIAIALCGATGALAAGTFTAELSGLNEVPPLTTETTGSAKLTFDEYETWATFELEVLLGQRITQAHIHCAPAGTNGPVVAWLAGLHARGWDVNGLWVSNATLTDENVMPQAGTGPCPNVINNLRDLAAAARAGNLYVNAHSVVNPGGEVRGQIAAGDDDDDDGGVGDDDDDDDDDDGARVCLCHNTKHNPHTICIDEHSVQAHLAHGDTLGECACGGPADVPCADGEFCKHAEGVCEEDAEGVCAEIPGNCPRILAPICGCDGTTYDNACLAGVAGVSVDRPGPCEKACGGATGATCDTDQFCQRPLGTCSAAAEGLCADKPLSCPTVISPVCGCDGTTYDNACLAGVAGVSVSQAGPCPTPQRPRPGRGR